MGIQNGHFCTVHVNRCTQSVLVCRILPEYHFFRSVQQFESPTVSTIYLRLNLEPSGNVLWQNNNTTAEYLNGFSKIKETKRIGELKRTKVYCKLQSFIILCFNVFFQFHENIVGCQISKTLKDNSIDINKRCSQFVVYFENVQFILCKIG